MEYRFIYIYLYLYYLLFIYKGRRPPHPLFVTIYNLFFKEQLWSKRFFPFTKLVLRRGAPLTMVEKFYAKKSVTTTLTPSL